MLLHYKFIITLLLFSLTLGCFAQKNAADKFFNKGQYYRAIPKYQKAINKTSSPIDKQACLINLAECYKVLANYKEAESCYKQAIAIGKVAPEVYYNYGNILKNNNNYAEALNNYMAYLDEKPTDSRALNALKSCQEIKYWQSKPQEYSITNLENLNTTLSEFCPTLLNNKLIFVAEKQNDYIEYKTNDVNGAPYLNVFYAKLKNNTLGKTKLLSKKVNTSYHDGPVAFSSDGKTMFLTRVNYLTSKGNKDFINRAKLYISKGGNKKWDNPLPFQFNSDDYSCAHATISADGNMLFFTSDMPGGFGGKDIWMCKKNGEGWDKPVNLGFDINTSGDEMFPFIRNDGMLFFSSDGLPGFGGLDILSAKLKEGKWLLNKNEGLLLNSNADDFGIYFVNDTMGYFSSNREGGKGQDDIYSFIFKSKYVTVDGTVLLTENTSDPAKDIKVYLLDAKGKRLDSTRTNEKGYFIFKNLEVDKVYLAEVEENQINLKTKSRYYLADKNNTLARISHKETDGKRFVFRNLPIDINGLPDLFNDDDELNLAGNLLYGDNPSKPLANKTVVVRNDAGDIVEKTTTNEFGAFAFRKLPLDQNYTLSVEDDDMPLEAKIILTNKSGKQLKVTQSDAKGKFKFNLLSVDKIALKELNVDDAELVMALKGYLLDQNKKTLPNAKITIFDNNTLIESIVTDNSGKFEFKNLGANKNYVFNLDETDSRLINMLKVYIADAKGRIYREIRKSSVGKFEYKLLEIDKVALGDFSVNDPWLEVLQMKNKQKQNAITIIENLTYATGDYKIDETGYNILNKVITVLNTNPKLMIELSSHTDSRSSDSYNLQLSQKRAKAAVDYLISKGIDKSRLIAVGYGETKLLNKCNNTTPCTEEEHAINRRTEFKIVENNK